MTDFDLARESLAGSRVIIDRFSRDAVSLARLLAAAGARVRIVDRDPISPALAGDCASLATAGVELLPFTDPNTLSPDFDLIFADLFHPPTRPFIVQARRRGQVVTSHADLILRWSRLPAVGVTGSAGKSTTTLLLHELLTDAGQTVHMGRDSVMENLWPNYELLDRLDGLRPPGWLLLELTSAHLEYMHLSPHVAVVTRLWPDHLDWHGSLDAYLGAKAVLLAHQSADDWAVLNQDDELIRRRLEPVRRGRPVYFSRLAEVPQGVFVRGDQVVARWAGREEALLPVEAISLPDYFITNVLAGCAAALVLGVPHESIRRVVPRYRGLPHRLQRVGRVNGAAVFADGMAITPGKARAAIEWFAPGTLVLVAGGAVTSDYSDGLHSSPEERDQVAEACRAAAARAAAIVLFGEAASLLQAELVKAGYPTERISREPDLRAAAHSALGRAAPGASVLFAPIYFVEPDERYLLDAALAEYDQPAARA